MLNKFVRTILEAAVRSEQAASKNLALLRKTNGDSVSYTLYDSALVTDALWGMDKTEDEELAVHDLLSEIPPESFVYGYIDVKIHKGDCWNGGEVKYSAARKGYGPLMYELAMSDFPNGIMPDRKGPSDKARNVWKAYEKRSDVKQKKLDNVKAPETDPKQDDCLLVPDFDGEEAYLNKVYSGTGDGGSKPALMQKHKEIAEAASEAGIKPDAYARFITDAGIEFFGTKYGS